MRMYELCVRTLYQKKVNEPTANLKLGRKTNDVSTLEAYIALIIMVDKFKHLTKSNSVTTGIYYMNIELL
jgi:hypothetical protein